MFLHIDPPYTTPLNKWRSLLFSFLFMPTKHNVKMIQWAVFDGEGQILTLDVGHALSMPCTDWLGLNECACMTVCAAP